MAFLAGPQALAGPRASAEPLALKAASGKPACYSFRKVFSKSDRQIFAEPRRFKGAEGTLTGLERGEN